MAEISQQHREKAQQLAAMALVGDTPAATEAAFAAIGIDDAKAFFCEHWDEIKAVLRMLGDAVGGVVKWAVKGLIAGGDYLHGKICPKA